MKIVDLKEEHPAIYKAVMEHQFRQRHYNDDELGLVSGFTWSETNEGARFWRDIDNGKFQVFYDRYTEHAKDPAKIEEKDWSKASDEELIAEAKRRYPIGTEIEDANYPLDRCVVVTGNFRMKGSDVYTETDRGFTYAFCKYRDCVKWAEIVSQPKEAIPEAKQPHGNQAKPIKYSELMQCTCSSGGEAENCDKKCDQGDNEEEPKAGDMVEVLNPDWRSGWIYLGLKNTKGHYICEDTSGKVQAFERIRLWKSEAESKAKELNEALIADNGKDAYYRLLDAINWGQANPTKK